MKANHIPVLCDEVIAMLAMASPSDMAATHGGQGIYIDATFGAGGMARAILAYQPKKLIAFDRDPTVVQMAKILQDHHTNFEFMNSNFGKMDDLLKNYQGMVDGVVFDLGVSSMQLDNAARGFSFMQDAPLDMRMTQGAGNPTAADIINHSSEVDLADIFYRYGEEKKSRLLARTIVAARKQQAINTTAQLSKLVVDTIGQHGKHHPATRVFQALRIAVNNELADLAAGLAAAEQLLKNGGRMVVISFHSLEDKIVKEFFKQRATKPTNPSRHLPTAMATIGDKASHPLFKILTKKPITPNARELAQNPRSRSAKLRAVMKIAPSNGNGNGYGQRLSPLAA